MTEAVFHAPKRRARVYEQFEAPLPVSPCAEDGRDVIVCRAEVICDNVIITNLEHIQHLYSRGYFGKGLFSRSRPEHMISQRWRNAGGRCLPVISASEYEKRLALAREALDLQGLEEESVHDVLQVLSKPVEFEGPRAEAIDATLTDDSGLLDRSEGASGRPRREGNPRFDPLAQLSPPEKPCLEAEPSANHHEYVLVEEGDGNSDADGRKLQCRINPFSILEYLQLSYEEAFFLTYALGCLSVFHNEESLSVAELWRKFRSLQPNFCFSYAVYHYFRSKGWVPKTGIKYGTDFSKNRLVSLLSSLILFNR
ncbi:hypothetical protein DNTS_023043 [Danionella cerebrum]|uniref:tRNA-splicing endonuclease subunit Sen2 n=1 Tax=Danionella cerebrum TaxID=2873325 RepID=A0A553Q5A1_9TELE|nr:hypothetical protein DNTS_023043 [Danionella translucida]TRY85102.1 hypothetical protein DNTS_023043 [Danionella translucida]